MRQISLRPLKAIIFLLCLFPFGLFLQRVLSGRLGANPVETISLTTGDWTMRFLIATLSITPLSKITGWKKLISFRRTLGLFAFFWGFLHLFIYIGLDHLFNIKTIFIDTSKTPYLIAGFISFLLLIPLAITSTKGWIRRLGERRWSILHRLVYISIFGGVIHYLLQVKSVEKELLIYSVVVIILLGYRLVQFILSHTHAKIR